MFSSLFNTDQLNTMPNLKNGALVATSTLYGFNDSPDYYIGFNNDGSVSCVDSDTIEQAIEQVFNNL